MSLFQNAFFIKRLNRFTVECERHGKRFKAYLPNPGRLWELLLPGRELYLKKSAQRYTVWAVKRDSTIVCLHTHYINDIAEKLINDGLFPGYSIKKREVTAGSHRIDFMLSSGSRDLILEVKSCTLYHDGIAMFPDAVTLRGKRHVEFLASNKGALLFIVPFPEADYFLPDFHTDPEFSATLFKARNRILIKSVSIRFNIDMSFEFIKELEIPWYIYEREASDRGSYILIGRLPGDKRIETGGLGRLLFKKGYYLYTGSAMNSLSARLKRHMKKKKSMRWHIDYLVNHLEELKPLAFRSSEPLECLLSKELRNIAEPVRGFGSSDCDCEGHLYWFRYEPLRDERFVEILLKYRAGRLRRLMLTQ